MTPKKEKPAPPPLPKDLTLFGRTSFRGEQKPFGIKREDRRKHVYIIGKTGMGKTTLIQNMIIGDIHAGQGVAIVDPHGDVAEDILDFIPNDRVNDVIYFNPADLDFPIAFNVFEQVASEHKYLVASGLVGVFKKLYAESWGPRLEYILRNTLLALLDYPQATLLGVLRILADKKYRNDVIEKIQDPVVKSFWVDEFSNYNEKFRQEAIAPIQNKVGQFLSSAIIRNIVGQVKSSFDLRDIMDNKKILILSMSKGKIGEDNASLLGSMMITKIQLAAMSRANIVEEKRQDFYLYVDEFQNFATESFANILSEARKYRLNLTVAHQYIEQMSEEVQAAVFGNVGTLIVFRIGAADAEVLEPEFDPTFLQADLVNLPAYNIYLKLMIDGLTSPAFSASTLPRLEAYRTTNREKIIAVSRERFGRPRATVEDRIKRWSGSAFSQMAFGQGQENMSAEERMEQKMLRRKFEETGELPKDDERELYNAVCHTCNQVIKVPFKPDGVRPVYCKDCLAAVQRARDVSANKNAGQRPSNARVDNPPAAYPTPQGRAPQRDRDRGFEPRPRSRDRDQARGPSRSRSGGPRGPRSSRPAAPPPLTPKPVSLREALQPVKQALANGQVRPALQARQKPAEPARRKPTTPPTPPTIRPRQKAPMPGTSAAPRSKRGDLQEGQEISFD
jgi:CxxC-x17-CxxC domain-containing protein